MKKILSIFLLILLLPTFAHAGLETPSDRQKKRDDRIEKNKEDKEKTLKFIEGSYTEQAKTTALVEELVKQNKLLNEKLDKLIESNETQNALFIEILGPQGETAEPVETIDGK